MVQLAVWIGNGAAGTIDVTIVAVATGKLEDWLLNDGDENVAVGVADDT